MADSTRSMRKSIFDRDILPFWKQRLLTEITPDDLRQLCAKVKARGAPATAIHVRDIVKQIFAYAWADITNAWLAGKNHKPTLYPPSMQMLA
jgi:hypothetical protein